MELRRPPPATWSRSWPSPGAERRFFADCLARQEAGEGVLLVGHTVTSWREHRRDGAPVTVSETIDMLVKRL
jgi:hypothetical protein